MFVVCCGGLFVVIPFLSFLPSIHPSYSLQPYSPSFVYFHTPLLSPQQATYYRHTTIQRWYSLRPHPYPGTHPLPHVSPSTLPQCHLQHPRATAILATVPAPAMIAASTIRPPTTPSVTFPPSQPRAHKTLLHHHHLLPSTHATSADTQPPNENGSGTATTAMDDCSSRIKSLHPPHHLLPHPLNNNNNNKNNLTRGRHSISISITSASSILIITNSNSIIASTTTRSTVNRRLRCMRAAAAAFSNIGLMVSRWALIFCPPLVLIVSTRQRRKTMTVDLLSSHKLL